MLLRGLCTADALGKYPYNMYIKVYKSEQLNENVTNGIIVHTV